MKDRKYYVEIKCDNCGKMYKKSKYRLEEKNFCRSCNMKSHLQTNLNNTQRCFRKKKENM